MRISLLFLLSFCAYSAVAQLRERFDDGNFTSDPLWSGNIQAFFVNPSMQLQTSSGLPAQTVYLSTLSNSTGTQLKWEFYTRMNFSPSANNLLRFYLSSDHEDLSGALNGYFIQIGESGDLDSYDLYRQTGTTVTRILAGADQPRADVNQLTARISVRYNNGTWTVSSDNTGGSSFVSPGSVADAQFTTGKWMGIYAKFTQANAGKFIFDDLILDELPSSPAYVARPNDIVINEVFADPSPVVNLPEVEFIELFNTTDVTISLAGWTFSDGATTATLPPDTLAAGAYLILCARADTSALKKFGQVSGLSPWPSLNNTGELLVLKDASGKLISEVPYSDGWYDDAVKKAGGWSLELADPGQLCAGSLNWRASADSRGGTPGTVNSIYKAVIIEKLKLLGAVIVDSVSLKLLFNRPLDSLSAVQTGSYSVNNGIGQPVLVSLLPDRLGTTIIFDHALVRGNSNMLTLSGLTDCAGGALADPSSQYTLFYPGKIKPGDLLVSEILFDPRPGGADFVEIYNPSQQTFDLKDISVASRGDTGGIINVKTVGSITRLIRPGEYCVLTTDPVNIRTEYIVKDTVTILKVSSLPSFNDDKGSVLLLNDNQVIDQFSYSAKMHFPLIKNAEGVSLERTSFKLKADDPGNFRSAAGAAGFATPGYQNSQFVSDRISDREISLVSKTFSPDNDGFEDELRLNYHFSEAGKVANAFIYNDRGEMIHRLVNNLTLGAEGIMSWNGLDAGNRLQKIGVYKLVLKVFDMAGNTHDYKLTFVLAAHL